jgi:hypothetical protein
MGNCAFTRASPAPYINAQASNSFSPGHKSFEKKTREPWRSIFSWMTSNMQGESYNAWVHIIQISLTILLGKAQSKWIHADFGRAIIPCTLKEPANLSTLEQLDPHILWWSHANSLNNQEHETSSDQHNVRNRAWDWFCGKWIWNINISACKKHLVLMEGRKVH